MFIDVIVIKNNTKEKRLINVNHIRQVYEYSGDESKIKLDLIDFDGYIIIESTLKEFKILLNNLKK
jgi:hypothetical protein